MAANNQPIDIYNPNETQEYREWVDSLLDRLYYNPTIGFIGRDKLYEKLEVMADTDPQQFGDLRLLKRADVMSYLRRQSSWQLHYNRKMKKDVQIISSTESNELWIIDLIDFSKTLGTPANRRVRYLFMIQDVYSRYLFVIPLKNKRPGTVWDAIEPLIRQHRPSFIRSDRGVEFNKVEAKSKDFGYKYIRGNAYSPHEQGTVERANLVIKRMIYTYMTQKGHRSYIDVLPQLVENYNGSYQKGIRRAPSDVYLDGEKPKIKRESVEDKRFPDLRAGDFCRISTLLDLKRKKNKFFSRFNPYWSTEIFEVIGRSRNNRYTLRGKKPLYQRQHLLFVPIDSTDTDTIEYEYIDIENPPEPLRDEESVARTRGRRTPRLPRNLTEDYVE